ncbi:MAG: hypothetical protein WCP35_03355 [Verrucomicrobiota bacterium]
MRKRFEDANRAICEVNQKNTGFFAPAGKLWGLMVFGVWQKSSKRRVAEFAFSFPAFQLFSVSAFQRFSVSAFQLFSFSVFQFFSFSVFQSPSAGVSE